MLSRRSLNMRYQEDSVTCTISGICQIDSGEIVVADFFNSKLKVLDDVYNVTGYCDTPTYPQDVCQIGGNSIVVSVDDYRERHELHFFRVRGGKPISEKTIKVDHACYSLAYNPSLDCLYASDGRCIFQYSTEGEKMRCVYKDFVGKYSVRSIAVSDNGQKVYVANLDKSQLVTMDTQGRRLKTISNLERPVSVCTSSGGHVFVACYGSHDVILMDNSGNSRQAILSPKDHIKPWSLSINEGCSQLVIGQGTNDEIFVFDCKSLFKLKNNNCELPDKAQ